MSTQSRRAQPSRRTRTHSRRNTVLNVDLNAEPPSEDRDLEGTSSSGIVPGNMTHGQSGAYLTPAAIDVEALDDDVIISSPRAFAEAKNNSRRNRGRVTVVDVESEDRSSRVTSNSRNKRRRGSTNQATNTGIHIDLEGQNCAKKVEVKSTAPPPPKEPAFSCPVCFGQLVDAMSTKCGHIFCKACIKASIAAQGKCPTCRRKTTMKDTIRVYLPTTS